MSILPSVQLCYSVTEKEYAFFRAIRKGNLKYLERHTFLDTFLSTKACQLAVEHNHLEILTWLIKHGCSCDYYTCLDIADKLGYLEIFNYLCILTYSN